jgi:hypothetical protein
MCCRQPQQNFISTVIVFRNMRRTMTELIKVVLFFLVEGNTRVSIAGTWVINTDICVGCKKLFGVINHFFISCVVRNFGFLDLTAVFRRI